jgi:outer membrane protein OmpA-like peptidoglycan-associated protein
MRKLNKLVTIVVLFFLTNNLTAQKKVLEKFDKSLKYYFGLRGGLHSFSPSQKKLDYLNGFNQPFPGFIQGIVDTSVNTIWGLKRGYFVELGGGIKYKKFGWGLWLGYQQLKRDNNLNFYNALSDLNGRTLDPINIPSGYKVANNFGDSGSAVNNIKSTYFLTGPEYYIGKLPFYLQLHAYIGLAKHTDKGYKTVDYKDLIDLTTSFSTGGESLRIESFGDNYTSGYQSMSRLLAKLGLQAEYFFLPRISLNIGADYNYTSIWNKTTIDYVLKLGVPVNSINTKLLNSNTVSDRKRELNYITANVGVKYWLGKLVTLPKSNANKKNNSTKPKKVVLKPEVKTVVVLVKDKCTGIELPNVNVSIKSDGVTLANLYTDGNGIAKFQNIEPQIVICNGIKNGVAATTGTLKKQQFASTSNEVTVTLLHDDPRFTLIGNATTQNGSDPIENVIANISNLTSKANSVAITNEKGEFYEQLEKNCNFKIVGQAKDKLSAVKEVTTRNLDRCKDLYVRLEMPMEKVEVGKTVVLKNIYYDINKFSIRPDAAKELDILVGFLSTNIGVKIEIASHTDSRSQDIYNLKLSQKRADEVVAYLVAKGIDQSRLVAKGYGETKLVNNCTNDTKCSEEEHQMNRRTEFKILDM